MLLVKSGLSQIKNKSEKKNLFNGENVFGFLNEVNPVNSVHEDCPG